MKSGVTIYEFDALAADQLDRPAIEGVHVIPADVFDWLSVRSLRASEDGDAAWLRSTHRRGRHVILVTSFVGVIRAPTGF